mgnify:CR=1 FL=1
MAQSTNTNSSASTNGKPHHIPPGLRGVIPQLVVPDARRAIAFIEKAFGAKSEHPPMLSPDGKNVMHAFVRVGDEAIFLSDAAGFAKPTTTNLFLYVQDVDAVHVGQAEVEHDDVEARVGRERERLGAGGGAGLLDLHAADVADRSTTLFVFILADGDKHGLFVDERLRVGKTLLFIIRDKRCVDHIVDEADVLFLGHIDIDDDFVVVAFAKIVVEALGALGQRT